MTGRPLARIARTRGPREAAATEGAGRGGGPPSAGGRPSCSQCNGQLWRTCVLERRHAVQSSSTLSGGRARQRRPAREEELVRLMRLVHSSRRLCCAQRCLLGSVPVHTSSRRSLHVHPTRLRPCVGSSRLRPLDADCAARPGALGESRRLSPCSSGSIHTRPCRGTADLLSLVALSSSSGALPSCSPTSPSRQPCSSPLRSTAACPSRDRLQYQPRRQLQRQQVRPRSPSLRNERS